MSNKIEMLDIVVMNHTEYLPRSQLQALGSPDLKQSPKVSKNMGKRGAKQPPQPQIQLPESMVTPNGVPTAVMSFLEVIFSFFLHVVRCLTHPGGRDDFANANAVPVLATKPATIPP